MPRPTHNETTYLPALDGLRALAVTLVILYHLDVPGFGGGLLGVGVFFTLSGFLITSLLLSTHAKTGGMGLGTFWLRRARRLIPAVVLVLAATLITAAIAVPDKLGDYSLESLTALFYVNNWFTIAQENSYFDQFSAPSPLSHMWSLSIEEQFYIVWPLLLALLFLLLKKRVLITAATIVLALVSFYLLYDLAAAGLDNTRTYEGTDTRAGGLLLGAAMAFWWPARAHHVGRRPRALIDGLGLAGLAGICWLAVGTGDTSMSLYSWGLLALTAATMAALAAAVTPGTLVARLLGLRPLTWIGERSYGIYLWHMPVVAFLPLAVRTESLLFGSLLVVGLTVLLASLSWRFVEDPIRRHGFIATFTGRRPDPAPAEAVHSAGPAGEGTPADSPTAEDPAAQEPAAQEPADEPPADEPTADTEAVDDGGAAAADDTAAVAVPAAERRPLPLDLVIVILDGGQPAGPEPTAAPQHAGAGAAPADEQPRNTRPLVEEPVDLTTPVATPASDKAAPVTITGRTRIAPPAAAHPRRRRVLAPLIGAPLVVLAAVAALVGTSSLDANMPIVRALTFHSTDDDGDLEVAEPEPTDQPVGPTLVPDLRRTRCTTVIHVGDSTSIGMDSADLQPDPRLRLEGQYKRVGATRYISDVVGGRSSLERLEGAPNAVESIEADLARGDRGCWVMAMGVNDTANVEAGGEGPVDMRIDRLLKPLGDQPVLWPTIITTDANQNPYYDNKAMRRFNKALLRACERYPNLRIYDWAAEVQPNWTASDGVHYSEHGYVERARRFATALATVFPADDYEPATCLITSLDVVQQPGDADPAASTAPISTAPASTARRDN